MLYSTRTVGWRGVVPFLLLLQPCFLRGVAGAPPAAAPPSAAPGRLNAPASLQEAAAVIDFRTFPTLEREELLHQSATKIGYRLARPDLAVPATFSPK